MFRHGLHHGFANGLFKPIRNPPTIDEMMGELRCFNWHEHLMSAIANRPETVSVDFMTQPNEEIHPKVRDLTVPRVWTVQELLMMPDGTIFHHSERGPCWIERRMGRATAMRFEKGGYYVQIKADDDPWTKPMMLIFCEQADWDIPF